MKKFHTELSFTGYCGQEILVQDGEYAVEMFIKEPEGQCSKVYLSFEDAKTLSEMLLQMSKE